ncbi:hypothetical protein PFLG_02761, partial [Plasmodium falciparum RAJ116]
NNYTRVEKKKYDVNCCKNIEDIKDEKDLEYFFYNYDKTNIDDIFNDYKYLINCKNHQKECSRKEMFEKAYIIKYISNNVQLFHFIKSKNIFHENKPPLQGDNNNNNNFKNFANFNNNHYNIWNQTNRYCGDQKYGQQNIYYIHNIEKAKINKEEILKNKDKNKCLQYVFDNDVYKFITHIKKCDIWNYKDKIVHKNYIHYHIFFPITYMDIEKRENCKMNTQNISYYINSNIFLHDVHRYNKDIFIDVIKKMNYKLLNSQDIKNLLIILTLLHHNNISFSTEKNNIIKNNNHDNTNNKIIYKNKEYINKRIFMDMFTNIYKTICSKRNNISFIYLYDYLLIMTLNEIKNKEYYISIVETLSNYMNLINKITNNNNNNNNNDNNIGDNHNNENIIYNNNNENIIYNNNCDSVLGSNSYNFYHNHENNTKQTYNKMNEQNKNYPQTEINLDHVITNSLNESHTYNIYDDDDVNRNFYDISKNDYLKNGEAAGKLDYVENVDKLFVHLKESIINDGIDIRGILWMPIAITSFLSSQCIFNFLPIYINLISQAFKKTQSPKLLSLLIRRHNILLHTIQTDIIPKKYIDQRTLNNLYHICKSKKDNSKEKLFVPDSSTFHIEVSNALLSLDIPHQKEVNIYPFTIDIYIQTSQNVSEQQLKKDNSYGEYHLNQHNLHTKLNKTNTFSYEHDTNFEQTFENKKVKHKSKNKNEVYTEIPFM